MAAAPSSGLSVAPFGEITSVRPKFPQRIVGISPEIARDGICMVSASKESGVGSAEPRYTTKPNPPQAGKVSSLVRRLAVHSARGREGRAFLSERLHAHGLAIRRLAHQRDRVRWDPALCQPGAPAQVSPSGGLAQVPLPPYGLPRRLIPSLAVCGPRPECRGLRYRSSSIISLRLFFRAGFR